MEHAPPTHISHQISYLGGTCGGAGNGWAGVTAETQPSYVTGGDSGSNADSAVTYAEALGILIRDAG